MRYVLITNSIDIRVEFFCLLLALLSFTTYPSGTYVHLAVPFHCFSLLSTSSQTTTTVLELVEILQNY
jgi:hypothetical protein